MYNVYPLYISVAAIFAGIQLTGATYSQVTTGAIAHLSQRDAVGHLYDRLYS